MTTTYSTTSAPKVFNATLYDEPVMLTKDADGRIIVITPAHVFLRFFEVEDAPWTTILGEVGLSGCQQLMDKLHGGYAAIACSRAN